jgi:beta-galactosidase
VAPNLYLASDETLRSLTAFVEAGGVLALGFFSAVVDENDHARCGADSEPLRRLIGARVDEVWPLVEGAQTAVSFASGTAACAREWTEWLELEGAAPLAWYASGPLDQQPAVVRNGLGDGVVYYCSGGLDRVGLAELVRAACDDARVEPVAVVPPGVEACRRRGNGRSYLFLLNHNDSPVEVQLPRATGVDLLRGREVGGTVRLDGLDVAVVREP